MKKKLLFVLNVDWYFEMHWLDRALRAQRQGMEIHVLTVHTEPAIFERISQLGIVVHSWGLSRSGANPFKELRSLASLFRHLKSIRPNVVHAATIKPVLYSAIATYIKKTPLVCTFPGLGTLSLSRGFNSRLIYKLICSCLRLLLHRRNVVACFENQQDMAGFVGHSVVSEESAARVYGAGVDLNRYAASAYPECDEFVVLFAARLLKDKGLAVLVDAVSMLRKQGAVIKLLIAGITDKDSSLAISDEELKGFARLDGIEYLGQRNDVPELIKRANCVALPTTYGEGVPRILIESAAACRPLIASNYGGCADICIDNITGLSIDPRSVSSVAEAIGKLISSPDKAQRMGVAGRELVEAKFSNKTVLEQNQAFYQRLLDSNES